MDLTGFVMLTGYGNTRERDVLAAYEACTGYSVLSRNDQYLIAPMQCHHQHQLQHQSSSEGTGVNISGNDVSCSERHMSPLQSHFMRFATPDEFRRMCAKDALERRKEFFKQLCVVLMGEHDFIKEGGELTNSSVLSIFDSLNDSTEIGKGISWDPWNDNDNSLQPRQPFVYAYRRTLKLAATSCDAHVVSLHSNGSVLHVLLDICEAVVEAVISAVDDIGATTSRTGNSHTDSTDESPTKRSRMAQDTEFVKQRGDCWTVDCFQITPGLMRSDVDLLLSLLDKHQEGRGTDFEMKDAEGMVSVFYSITDKSDYFSTVLNNKATKDCSKFHRPGDSQSTHDAVVDLTMDDDDSGVDEDLSPRRPSLYSVIIWRIRCTRTADISNRHNQDTGEPIALHHWSPSVASSTVHHPLHLSTATYPDYYLIGLVDGLSHQLDCSDACASKWATHTIVRYHQFINIPQ